MVRTFFSEQVIVQLVREWVVQVAALILFRVQGQFRVQYKVLVIAQHGSWNRKPPSGYKVVFVPFKGGRPEVPMRDVLTGFLDGNGDANGRPVGVVIDRRGALLVADDVGNTVWRVSAAR